MKKEIRYPLTGFAIGAGAGLTYSMLDQYYDLKERGLSFWDNVDGSELLKYCTIGGGLGFLGGHLYHRRNFKKEASKPFEGDSYAKAVLRRYGRHNSSASILGKKIRDEVKDFIKGVFNSKLVSSPLNWGSTARGTAINSNYDYDLLVPFSKESFSTLEEMYTNVHYVLSKKYKSARIRKQGRSIGLTFSTAIDEVHIDVVPGREIGNYKIDGELNLYVKGGVFKSSTRIKTNAFEPREMTKNRPKEREIVKLMKAYRDMYGFEIGSTFLQHLVFEAFDKRPVTKSISENLIYAMGYLSDKLSCARIVDPGNSNNIISDHEDSYAKSQMANQLMSDLQRLRMNKHYLKELFQI